MTPPRFIVPGQLCFVTARAVARMFKFLPEHRVVQIIRYVFAVAVQKYGLKVHEVMFMSNHFHLLATDVRGELPDFMRYLDSLLARSLNALRGTSGSLFEKHYNLVVATDGKAVIEHAKYILANPCAAHLVKRSSQWEGFSSRRIRYGQMVTFSRPPLGLWQRHAVAKHRRTRGQNARRAAYRGLRSKLPEQVGFTLHRPDVRPNLDDRELRTEVWRRLRERARELIAERSKSGREVLGMPEVLRQKWWWFPGRPEDMFTTTPSVSGRNKWARIEALTRKRDFEDAYYRVREAYIAGMREIVWPWGTWLMRVRHGLPCATAPP